MKHRDVKQPLSYNRFYVVVLVNRPKALKFWIQLLQT